MYLKRGINKMNIEMLRENNPELIKQYAYDEIKYIENLTGKPVDIVIVKKIKNGSDGLTKIARPSMEKTIIYVKESVMKFINHLILHECGHIRRIFSVEENERVNLSTTLDTYTWSKLNKVFKEIARIGIPENNIPKVFNMYINGITSQVFNTIPDIRIENRIYEEYEQNRAEQKAYLNYLLKVTEEVLSEKATKHSPETILEISLALNFLLLDKLKKIIGTRVLNLYKKNPLAKKGYNKIKNTFIKEDLGYKQDIELTENILKEFDINFVRWTDFNRVYPGYENDY